MVNKKAVIIGFLCFLTCCNYKILVNKRKVVQEEQGYLVFREDETTFFPYKDTIDANFLREKKKKRGYRIQAYDVSWLDSLSTDYSYAMLYKGDKKLSIIPVEVRSYLGNEWQEQFEESTFSYRWENKIFTMRYRLYDYRSFIQISVVRETDIKRLRSLKVELPKSH